MPAEGQNAHRVGRPELLLATDSLRTGRPEKRGTAQQAGQGQGVPNQPSPRNAGGRINDTDPSGAPQELGTLSEAPDAMDAPETARGGRAFFGETGVCVSLARSSYNLTRDIPASRPSEHPRQARTACRGVVRVRSRAGRDAALLLSRGASHLARHSSRDGGRHCRLVDEHARCGRRQPHRHRTAGDRDGSVRSRTW